MGGGTISGNTASNYGGGVCVQDSGIFTMQGGIIYGSSEGAIANTAASGASLHKNGSGTAEWGAGVTGYIGGAAQASGSAISTTEDALSVH
jgi:hypothetical protein